MSIDRVFSILLRAIIVVMLVCCSLAVVKKNKYSKPVLKLLLSGVISASFYCFYFMFDNETIANYCNTGYFISSNFVLLFFVDYLFIYADIKLNRKVIINLLWTLLVVDSIAIIANQFTGFMFTLEFREFPLYDIALWCMKIKPPFYFSLGYSYILSLACFVILIYRTVKSTSLYRGKFLYILLIFTIILVLNGATFLLDLPFDISILVLGLLGIVVSYFSLYSVPKSVIVNTNAFVVDDMNSGVLCFDVQNRCISSNKKAREFFQVCDKEDTEKFEKYLTDLQEKYPGGIPAYEQWDEVFIIEGEKRFFFLEYYNVKDKRNDNVGCFIMIQDRTDEIKALQDQQYRASHDDLTDLYNRKSFFEEGKKIINRLTTVPKLMITFNIKDFKLINDLFGVPFGDKVLIRMAEIIKDLTCDSAVSGRISGDRFALIIPKKKYDEKQFLKSMGLLQEMFSESNYKIHVNMGVYEISNVSEAVQSMYDKADLAINSIKDEYDKKVVYYDTTIMDRLLYEKNIVNDFDKAIINEEFVMYLQPQFNTMKEMLGAEALVRWNHPTNGLLFPGTFIQVFEDTGLIYKLDKYIWKQAVKKLRQWKDRGMDDYYISVNVSPKDSFYLDIYAEFTGLVEEYEVDPKNLKIEITETAMMSDSTKYFELFNKLRRYGFILEIDDFGSGYSSLNIIKDVPADVLKLDMMFLRGNADKEKNQAIIKTIIELSKALGMQVVTEGVETADQVDSLSSMGCDIFQGYYFEKPIPVKDFERIYMTPELRLVN